MSNLLNKWTTNNTANQKIIYKEMKESTLVKLQYDLKLVQQALVVALNKIEALEKKQKKS